MKIGIPIPSVRAIALVVCGFAIGGATAFALRSKLDFLGGHEAGATLKVAADHHVEDSGHGHPSDSGQHRATAGASHDEKDATHAAPSTHEEKSGHAEKAAGEAQSAHEKHAAAAADHQDASAGSKHSARLAPTSTLDSAAPAETSSHGKSSKAVAHTSHWSYEGDEGPEHWSGLTPEYASCAGLEQTPIDLVSGIKGDVGTISFSYKEQPLRITNNGHTIQVNAAAGNFISINGKRYELAQFHFHHPSEHLLDGKAFDMEVHLVHKSADGAIAVVGVFMTSGSANRQIQQIFSQMPKSTGENVVAKGRSNPMAFLPKDRSFYRYMGSLTTPPCTEGLTWTVFKEPIEISAEQLGQFAELFPHNARPVQERNRRFLLEASAK